MFFYDLFLNLGLIRLFIVCLNRLHLKNYQNFKDDMTNEYSIKGNTLKQRIEAMPEDSILFRSDFTEYHTEFVGSVLSELTAEGMLVKISYEYWLSTGIQFIHSEQDTYNIISKEVERNYHSQEISEL